MVIVNFVYCADFADFAGFVVVYVEFIGLTDFANFWNYSMIMIDRTVVTRALFWFIFMEVRMVCSKLWITSISDFIIKGKLVFLWGLIFVVAAIRFSWSASRRASISQLPIFLWWSRFRWDSLLFPGLNWTRRLLTYWFFSTPLLCTLWPCRLSPPCSRAPLLFQQSSRINIAALGTPQARQHYSRLPMACFAKTQSRRQSGPFCGGSLCRGRPLCTLSSRGSTRGSLWELWRACCDGRLCWG